MQIPACFELKTFMVQVPGDAEKVFSVEQTFPEKSHSDLREFISFGLWGNTASPMYLFKSLPSKNRIPSRLCQVHADLATSGCVQPHCSHILSFVHQVILIQSFKEHFFSVL